MSARSPMMARRDFASDPEFVASLLVKENLFGPTIGQRRDDPSEMASFCGKSRIAIPRFDGVGCIHTDTGGRMKKGDVVMVYEDPITEKKPEGKATLVRFIDTDNDGYVVLKRWEVMFADDEFGGRTVCDRAIRDHAAEQKQRTARIRKRLQSSGLY